MVGVPGFLARFLTRVFVQGSGGAEKYSFTVLHGRRNTALQYYRDGENLRKNHVITNPILFKIPCIENLAVQKHRPQAAEEARSRRFEALAEGRSGGRGG